MSFPYLMRTHFVSRTARVLRSVPAAITDQPMTSAVEDRPCYNFPTRETSPLSPGTGLKLRGRLMGRGLRNKLGRKSCATPGSIEVFAKYFQVRFQIKFLLMYSGVSAASGLLGKPGTYQKSPGSWDLRYPYQKLKSLRIWPTIFREWPNFG